MTGDTDTVIGRTKLMLYQRVSVDGPEPGEKLRKRNISEREK